MKQSCTSGAVMEHLFHAGDNLDGLARLAASGTRVDLVYIDPPFATNTEFLMDSDRANTVSASGKLAYADTLRGGDYLEQLRLRLEAIRSVMAADGSIYVHIDVKMEHHVRLLMDAVLGARNFRNSITRIKCNPKNFSRLAYGNIKDTILFYSVSPYRIKWQPQEEPMTDNEAESRYPWWTAKAAVTPRRRCTPRGSRATGLPADCGEECLHLRDGTGAIHRRSWTNWTRPG